MLIIKSIYGNCNLICKFFLNLIKNYQWNSKKKMLYYICLLSLYEYSILSHIIKIAYSYSKNDIY